MHSENSPKRRLNIKLKLTITFDFSFIKFRPNTG